MALTAEQRIEKMHIDLMKHSNFVAYSGILMIGETKVCDKTPTAYTNGRDVTFGREFVSKLSDAELRGLILHEAKHKMYRHLTMWHHLFKRNPQKANMACDYVINLEILEESRHNENFIKLPKGGLIDEKYFIYQEDSDFCAQVKALGFDSRVQSPTFVICRRYTRPPRVSQAREARALQPDSPDPYSPDQASAKIDTIHHVDLYRLTSKEEALHIGLGEILEGQHSLILIEWPELSTDFLPKDVVEIHFKTVDENTRHIIVKGLD